ncbi:hypothetical protein A5670_07670 [Mycolicibacterium fortuitum]|nr:hypothetical protein A5670_07670 [Mycolicibacterium fortuitum]
MTEVPGDVDEAARPPLPHGLKFAVPHPARLDAAPHVDQQEQLRRLDREAMVPFPDELREVGELLPLLAAEHCQWS